MSTNLKTANSLRERAGRLGRGIVYRYEHANRNNVFDDPDIAWALVHNYEYVGYRSLTELNKAVEALESAVSASEKQT